MMTIKTVKLGAVIPIPCPTTQLYSLERLLIQVTLSEAVEVDNSGVIEGEDLMDLPLGDPEKVPSEDEVDKANSLRCLAQ